MPRVTAVWYGQVRPSGFLVNVPTNLISMAGRKFTQQIWVSSYIVLQKDLRVRTLSTFLSRTASDATASALAAMLCEAAERMVATASGVNKRLQISCKSMFTLLTLLTLLLAYYCTMYHSSDFTCTCTSRTSVVQVLKCTSRRVTKARTGCNAKGVLQKGLDQHVSTLPITYFTNLYCRPSVTRMCSAAQVIQVAGRAMSAGRRPSLFLISTLARAFSKASTTGASSTVRTDRRDMRSQKSIKIPRCIATMRMMAHFFHQLLWTNTSIIIGVFIPFILENRSIQHYSMVRRLSMANRKLCNSFQALAAYAATWMSTFGSRYFHQLKATAKCSGFWAKSPHFGGLQPNAALWNHRSQLSRGWKRFSFQSVALIDLLLTFSWPFLENVEPFVFKSISTTQCEPSSTIALASNSTLAPRPSTARCKGLRPCGSPGTARVIVDIWVCLKMLCTPKPNGFADHYPYEKWL